MAGNIRERQRRLGALALLPNDRGPYIWGERNTDHMAVAHAAAAVNAGPVRLSANFGERAHGDDFVNRNGISRAEDRGVAIDLCTQDTPVGDDERVVLGRQRHPSIECGHAADHRFRDVHATQVSVVFLRGGRRFLSVTELTELTERSAEDQAENKR